MLILLSMLFVAACSPAATSDGGGDEHAEDQHELALPQMQAVDLGDGEKLTVVATTNIIGDVVANVGGDDINLTVLMDLGQDPHTYIPTAREIGTLEDADVIFVNGFGLEEGLLDSIEASATHVPVVAVSTSLEPLPFGRDHDDEHPEDAGHDHAEGDPHVWLDPTNVIVWVENIEQTLSTLDPANQDAYEANAEAYTGRLIDLDANIEAQVATIPPANRVLVTNHESLGYFAARYGFEIAGTVITGGGTDSEPSARDIAELVTVIEREDVPAIFIETTVSESLADVVASEAGRDVAVLTIYTGSLGASDSGADTYIGMMQVNADTIVRGLAE